MTIFDYPFTDIENYPIVSPFEPDDFIFEPRLTITFHIEGQVLKKWNSEDREGACFQKASCEKFQSWKESWTH